MKETLLFRSLFRYTRQSHQDCYSIVNEAEERRLNRKECISVSEVTLLYATSLLNHTLDIILRQANRCQLSTPDCNIVIFG
jgi:hypothetical protein